MRLFFVILLLASQAHGATMAFLRGPDVSTEILPNGLAAWFANDWSGASIPEYLGTGPGVMDDSGGPVILTYDPADGAWVYFPTGISTCSITTPYHASFDVTGDNEIQVKAWALDWTPATNRYVFLRGSAAATEQWAFRVLSSTSGALQVVQNNAGDSRSSSVANSIANGDASWIRARVDVGTDTQFDTSADGSTWNDLGTNQSDIGAATTEGTLGIVIGASSSAGANQWDGGIYQVRWYSGLVGSSPTQIIDFDAADFVAPYATANDSLGRTYTINRPASGLQPFVVDRSMIVGDGSNDYLTIADHAQLDLGAGSWTVSVLVRVQNVSASRNLISNKNGTAQGWQVAISGTTITGNASDGTDNVTTGGSTITQGMNTLVSLIMDGTTLYLALDGVRDAGTDATAVDSVTNANALEVLRNSSGGYADGVAFMGLELHAAALSEAECLVLKTEMTAANQ